MSYPGSGGEGCNHYYALYMAAFVLGLLKGIWEELRRL